MPYPKTNNQTQGVFSNLALTQISRNHPCAPSFDFLLKKVNTLHRNQNITYTDKEEFSIATSRSFGYGIKFPNTDISFSTRTTAAANKTSAFTKATPLSNTTNGDIGVYFVYAITRKTGSFLSKLNVSANIDIVLFKSEHDELLIKVDPAGLSCAQETHTDIWQCMQDKIVTITDNILAFDPQKCSRVENHPILKPSFFNEFNVSDFSTRFENHPLLMLTHFNEFDVSTRF